MILLLGFCLIYSIQLLLFEIPLSGFNFIVMQKVLLLRNIFCSPAGKKSTEMIKIADMGSFAAMWYIQMAKIQILMQPNIFSSLHLYI